MTKNLASNTTSSYAWVRAGLLQKPHSQAKQAARVGAELKRQRQQEKVPSTWSQAPFREHTSQLRNLKAYVHLELSRGSHLVEKARV